MAFNNIERGETQAKCQAKTLVASMATNKKRFDPSPYLLERSIERR